MTESPESASYIIDKVSSGEFYVHRSVFTDPHVYELEQRVIFARSWLYVGHESEVRAPGDFVTRKVAGHPLLFVRGTDGDVRVFFNTCAHEGCLVARVAAGNCANFQCFFHGWTYDTSGRLVGLPGEQSYGGDFKRETHGLKSPARVKSFRGFVFMNLDPDAPDLADYLGGAQEYIALVADQSEAGMGIVPGVQRYTIRANWKMAAMNGLDGYHVGTTHATFFQYLKALGVDLSKRRPGPVFDLGYGHSSAEFQQGAGRPIARWNPPFPPEMRQDIERKRRELEDRFGVSRAEKMTQWDRNLFLFPNLFILDHSAITVRAFQPAGPDCIDVCAWALGPIDEPDGARRMRMKNFLAFWGPAGFATPDDMEALEAAQQGIAYSESEWTDVSKGALRNLVPGGEARQGTDYNDELQVRGFWRRWKAMMAV